MGKLKVCVSLAGNMADILRDLHRAKVQGADLVELRLDLIPEFDLPALLQSRALPVLITCRSFTEGGNYIGSEEDRLAILRQANQLGAEYIDIEPGLVGQLHGYGQAKLIASHHNLQETPASLYSLYKQMAGCGADIVKIAVTANDIADNLSVFDLLQRQTMPTIALAMGEAGVMSRILPSRYDGFLTFATLKGNEPVAPGQVDLETMLKQYRVKQINSDTALYGVIANPVGHSLSPAVHNAAFAQYGMNALYLPLLVKEPLPFLKSFSPLGFQGYSVTIPHKQTVISALAETEPIARRIGAVNTLVRRDELWYGYNTDVPGVMRSIDEGLPPGRQLFGMKALIVGAGGLSRALAYGLTAKGVEVVIANRTLERAQALAMEVGAKYCSLAEMPAIEADLLLQTTSVGMSPHSQETIVPKEMLRPGMIVYDAVYNPLQTLFLQEAAAAGCIAISGIEHFINQAALQFEMWTGKPAPRELMRQVMLEHLLPGQ